MQLMRKKMVFVIVFFAFLNVHAQIVLVKNGLPVSRIVVVNDHPEEKTAALLLQGFIEKISGAKLPMITKIVSNKSGDIILDNSDPNKPNELKKDGFYLSCKNNQVHIFSAGGKGVIYGAITLL